MLWETSRGHTSFQRRQICLGRVVVLPKLEFSPKVTAGYGLPHRHTSTAGLFVLPVAARPPDLILLYATITPWAFVRDLSDVAGIPRFLQRSSPAACTSWVRAVPCCCRGAVVSMS